MAEQINLPNGLFDILQATIYKYSKANKTALNIPDSVLVTLLAFSTSWGNFWKISKEKNNATSIDRNNTRTTKDEYIAFLRVFVKQYYYDNPLATNSDILSIGLKPHPETRNLSKTINNEIPTISITHQNGYILKIRCLNSSEKKSKPEDVVFIRVKWFIGDVVPDDPKLWPLFEDFTKQPIHLQFEAEDAGKTLTVVVCYVHISGKQLSYSYKINTLVPWT